jgi:hypothetical protein
VKVGDGGHGDRLGDEHAVRNETSGLKQRVGSTEKKCEKQRTGKGADYEIGNKFWYYLFKFGAFLGDDAFYISFYPFWIWNIDGAVGRRLCVTWSIAMYFGEWPLIFESWNMDMKRKFFKKSLMESLSSTHQLSLALKPARSNTKWPGANNG